MSDTTPNAGQPAPEPARVVAVMAARLLTVARATAAASGLPHNVLLDALLTTYASELVQHPCCWELAAAGLRHLATRVEGMHVDHAMGAERMAHDAIARAARPAA